MGDVTVVFDVDAREGDLWYVLINVLSTKLWLEFLAV